MSSHTVICKLTCKLELVIKEEKNISLQILK